MIKDLFTVIVYYIASYAINGLVLIIKGCKEIIGFIFTPTIKISMDDPLYVIFIKQMVIFILYTASAVTCYYIHLLFDSNINLMDNLITMWCVMLVVECIIPMVKRYIKDKT